MAFRFGDGRDFSSLSDLTQLGEPYLGYRHVVVCAPEDTEAWGLSAAALGVAVVVIEQPGLPEGTAITWQARAPKRPKTKREATA